MSRCFPFPPPGYEKARIDNTDLLKKEKHKEKKQKKDKKEKEKREGKEKQDKDRSKEKHKEKKERKEKHKDKDRDRDKDKSKTSDEKKLEGQPRLSNGEKLSSNSLQKSDNKDKNSLHLQELAKRIRDEDRASRSQMVPKVATSERGDLVRTVLPDKSFGNQHEEKDKVKNKIADLRKVNGQSETRVLEQNFSYFDKGVDRVEAIIKLEEKKNVEKQMDGKEKSKHKEFDDKGDKVRDREREKSKRSKDKDRGKEEKKKTKEIIEPSKEQLKPNENVSRVHQGSKDSLDFRNIKSRECLNLSSKNTATVGILGKPKELERNDSLDFRNMKSPESLNLSTTSTAAVANLGKRKELERNGYVLDNGSRANKFPRNDPVVENGKKLEPCQTTFELTSEPRLANNHEVDEKEQKINGSIGSGIQAKQNGENFSKPPHPDMKYLSRILSVPKMEEWSDVDEMNWLYSSVESQSKKATGTGSSWNEGTQQVWAEAFRIESVDIAALPYVIPY
ncbi:uncharacterized protein [Euphorbia lathyris]|uniref:uncharacterized protein isoform X2 n=1 Tax=Euphorbia lathyris TaxID=212925 RepID=UPI00331443AF